MKKEPLKKGIPASFPPAKQDTGFFKYGPAGGKGAFHPMEKLDCGGRIGIYVRESRDDNGERYETIETQREMLRDYVLKHSLGTVFAVYEDDNISGSGFERPGIGKLRDDVRNARIDLLLVKDLSRLGRNNAKTLQFLDFLEEQGIRVLSSDGRYDSRLGDDILGIETWANERYVRDISRKIRSSLRFKIQRGEYVGRAPFGYRKAAGEGNRLFADGQQAEVVRRIYGLYLSGLGYSSVADRLNREGCPSPGGKGWNRISVRRILISSVYIGNTVQGVSERISFKSKKARRLPKESWVVTEGTHEAIVPREDYEKVQNLRIEKKSGRGPHKDILHSFRGLLFCGGCGSVMYARKSAAGMAYLCGNYCRKGSEACTSHRIREEFLQEMVAEELRLLFSGEDVIKDLERAMEGADGHGTTSMTDSVRFHRQLEAGMRQQDLLYADRLEGRISEELFARTNRMLEGRISSLRERLSFLIRTDSDRLEPVMLLEEIRKMTDLSYIPYDIVNIIVDRITVYEEGDAACPGTVVFEFKMK